MGIEIPHQTSRARPQKEPLESSVTTILPPKEIQAAQVQQVNVMISSKNDQETKI